MPTEPLSGTSPRRPQIGRGARRHRGLKRAPARMTSRRATGPIDPRLDTPLGLGIAVIVDSRDLCRRQLAGIPGGLELYDRVIADLRLKGYLK